MNFQPTEEQNLIRETVRSFAETEAAPLAKERAEQDLFDRELMYDKVVESRTGARALGVKRAVIFNDPISSASVILQDKMNRTVYLLATVG